MRDRGSAMVTHDAAPGRAMLDAAAGVWAAARRLAGQGPRAPREARQVRPTAPRALSTAATAVAPQPGRGSA